RASSFSAIRRWHVPGGSPPGPDHRAVSLAPPTPGTYPAVGYRVSRGYWSVGSFPLLPAVSGEARRLIQLRQQHDALLLVRVGAGDDGDARLGLTAVGRQVRDACRDVDEVARAGDDVLAESFSVPHL